jgi:isoleucyl-tRNA synthetase
MLAAFEGLDPAELFITSGAELVPGDPPADAFSLSDVPGIGVIPTPAAGEKCARCWKVLEEVGRSQPDDVCGRCADALSGMGA